MKKFAFFLPQFHEIPENDEWWGKGFTEWTNVKKAKPLYKGHIQPNLPINQYFYNLLDKKTVEWQTNLMHEYEIDGMVYYHYYFKGRMLLEKPAENLLVWKDVKQPFFFCWANHTWNRAWKNSREVLMEQTYGTEADWEKHFEYLLPFFKDERYEKKDNKPIFMIFNSNFKEKKAMMQYFEKRCIESGFNGIYVIETYTGYGWPNTLQGALENKSLQTEKIFFREPNTAGNIYKNAPKSVFKIAIKIKNKIGHMGIGALTERIPGNELFQIMMQYEKKAEFLHGLFFEWDNTPRHGSRGYIITPPDKEVLFQYMDSIRDEDYVFINAWNEWAEGMVLEPTEKNQYKYLEWIKEWTDKQIKEV